MPKKEIEYEKIIHLRVTDKQYNTWTEYVENKENDFTSISSLVRYAVDELIEGNKLKNSVQLAIEKEVKKLDKKYDDIVAQNLKILKKIANKSPPPQDTKIREFQTEFIENLFKEKPRDEKEIQKLVPNLTITETIDIINGLIEATIIEPYKDKYKYREEI